MKILRVCSTFDASYGGPSNSVAVSAIAVHRAGVDITVAFPHRTPASASAEPAVAQLHAAGVKTMVFPLNRRFAVPDHTWGISTALARWLWRHAGDYDVVHISSPWGLHCIAAVLAARRWRTPAVLSPHTSFTRFDMATAHNPWLRLGKSGLLAVYRRLLAGVVYSSALEQRDSNNVGRAPEVIYHAVGPVVGPAGSALDAQPRRHRGKRITVGFLGRLHPVKNLEGLLTALHGLPDNVDLVIAGDGPADYIAAMRQQADTLGLGDRVRWTGFVKGAEKATFLRDIDVLVMPSHHECFGMVAAEAMAAGTAVVVSRDTGISEVVEEFDAGVVTEATPAAIQAAVARLVSEPMRTRLAENGRRAAEQALSPGAHGRALRAYYEKVAA